LKFNDSFIPGLAKSPEVRAIVQAKAEQVAAAARASAPVDTGDYRDSIHVEMVTTPFRVVGKVVASSDHAMLVESQTGNLKRALRAAASRA
jgi:Bacteriophage HK97-gp10, putative tail-component